MELDPRTTLIIQISAAVASNALAALRASITDAKAMGMTVKEIREIIKAAQAVQEQPLTHAQHLIKQLMREPIRPSAKDHNDPVHAKPHVHNSQCGCGHDS